jgi:hypothetical protein
MRKHDPVARARVLRTNLRVRAAMERAKERHLIVGYLRGAWKQGGLWDLLEAMNAVERGEHRRHTNGQSPPEPAPPRPDG